MLNCSSCSSLICRIRRTLLGAAQERITSYGITLDYGNMSDVQLVIQYASYLYRLRNSSEGMPRSLQYALHSRLVNEKGGVQS